MVGARDTSIPVLYHSTVVKYSYEYIWYCLPPIISSLARTHSVAGISVPVIVICPLGQKIPLFRPKKTEYNKNPGIPGIQCIYYVYIS